MQLDFGTLDDGNDFAGPGATGSTSVVLQRAPVILFSPLASSAYAGGSVNATDVSDAPAMANAGTVYGDDPSASNNFGLGLSAPSVAMLNSVQKGNAARPSLWWLFGALAVLGLVL